jgi:UDP-hydrolysing UDP-N-acetyl-D-glucosamine 2-epimerase
MVFQQKMKRNIAVVTGSRAEYGLLKPLITLLQADLSIELQLVVCCTHLLEEFGLTYRMIEKDGFVISEKIDMLLAANTAVGITKSVGLGLLSFSEVWVRLKPDIVVILGDRFEMVSVALSTFIARIPLAHIHGGELSFGSLDDGFRHAVTKLSHLHFVAAKPYAKRIIQLGEEPWRVHHVGALGIDAIKQLTILEKEKLKDILNLSWGPVNFLVTYHPCTISPEFTKKNMYELLKALDNFPNAHVIFTHTNADEGGRIITKLIKEYVRKNSQRCYEFTNLGSEKYLSVMKYSDIIIGNSSSGLIEAPYFKKPTVNIGKRQDARLKATSVIDCDERSDAITEAIEKGLSLTFQEGLERVCSPYQQKNNAALQIRDILKTVSLENIVEKHFHDQ